MSKVSARKGLKSARSRKPQLHVETMLPGQRRSWLLGGTGLLTGSVVMAAASFMPAGPAWATCVTVAGVSIACDAVAVETNGQTLTPAADGWTVSTAFGGEVDTGDGDEAFDINNDGDRDGTFNFRGSSLIKSGSNDAIDLDNDTADRSLVTFNIANDTDIISGTGDSDALRLEGYDLVINNGTSVHNSTIISGADDGVAVRTLTNSLVVTNYGVIRGGKDEDDTPDGFHEGILVADGGVQRDLVAGDVTVHNYNQIETNSDYDDGNDRGGAAVDISTSGAVDIQNYKDATIDGTQGGIVVYGSGLAQNSVNFDNAGSIFGNERAGVYLENVGDVTGTNSSMTSMVGADGLAIDGALSVDYDNSGGLTEGTDDEGIDLDNITGDVKITNNKDGVIKGHWDGVDIDETGGSVLVDNKNGTIEGGYNQDDGGSGVDISDVDGDSDDSVKILNNGDAYAADAGTIRGDSFGIEIDDIETNILLIDNSYGGMIDGDGDDGINIHEVNFEGAGAGLTILNNGGAYGAGGSIFGEDDGVRIRDTQDGNILVDNRSGGTIEGQNGEGVEITDVIGGNVTVDNRDGGSIAGKDGDGVKIEEIDDDGNGGGNVFVYNDNSPGSITGYWDGVDIEDVEHDVTVTNKGGKIEGQHAQGIDISDVWEGGVKVDNSWSGVVLGAKEGILIENVQGGLPGGLDSVLVDNSYGGSVTGKDGDGVKIEEIDEENGMGGKVTVLNNGGDTGTGGTIVGYWDGVDIEDVDHDVLVNNSYGGSITGQHAQGVDIEDVWDGNVTVNNTYGGTILGATDGVKIENVSKDLAPGLVLVNNVGGTITGQNGDGVKIEEIDDLDVTVLNGSSITGYWDGVDIEDVDDGLVTVTNYAHGKIEGQYGSGVDVDDANEDVTVNNEGYILGKGGWRSAVIKVDTRDALYINNFAGGVIESNYVGVNANNWGDIAIRARTNDGTTIENWGRINGRVILDNENDVFNNYSDDSWNVSGKNFFGWGDWDVLNNTGTINIDNWTAFFGLDDLYNAGGLINMHQYYYNGTNEKLFTTGDFHGKQNASDEPSYLQVDTYFAPWGHPDGDSDLLKVKGYIDGQTEIIVHKANSTPGGINWKGIDVVEYKEWGWGGSCADYFCKEGDTFFISALSPYYVNIGGYGTIEDGMFSWFLKHDYYHHDYEFVSMWGPGAVNAPGVITGAQNIFYDTLRVVEDNKYGYQFNGTGGGGADLPIEEAPVASDNGTNAGVWVKARGSWTERDTSIEQNGVKFDTSSSQDIYSILGGADVKPWGEDSPFRAGLFGGYVMSALDFDLGTGTSADYEGGVVGGYIAYNNGAFYVDATVKGDLLNTTYSFAGIDADADVTSIGGSLNTGYRMYMGPGFIEPIASLEFVHSQVDDFDDGGASVDFSNGQSIRAGAGAKVGTNFATAGGTTTELSLLGKVWNEFEDANTVSLDDGMGNTASFSDDISGIFGEVAATATIVSADGTASGFFSVGGQFGEDSMSLRAEAGARKGF